MKKFNFFGILLLLAVLTFSCCNNKENQTMGEQNVPNAMKLDLFFNFDGNCKEAAEFYATVFQSEVLNLMTYGQAPAHPDYPLAEVDRDKICYCEVKIGDLNVMFMDMPSGSPFIAGNNINPTICINNKEEIERIFNELKIDGEVYMELQKTFFGELYGMVKDKYDVVWQILQPLPDMNYEGAH